MSAVARDYVYQVCIDPKKKKDEPCVSGETLAKYCAEVKKYLRKEKETDGR